MTDRPSPIDSARAFARKHPVAVAIGAVLLLIVAASGEEQPHDVAQPYAGGSDGGTDMDAWRRRNDADDIQQRDRIDSIREVERCTDPETGETREVSIHTGC